MERASANTETWAPPLDEHGATANEAEVSQSDRPITTLALFTLQETGRFWKDMMLSGTP